jgi:hypothetical protein
MIEVSFQLVMSLQVLFALELVFQFTFLAAEVPSLLF